MSIVGLDENNISSFLESFVDAGVKITDELNLFEDDGLFASIPYGKIVNYVTKKIIQIANPNEALKKAVALAIATNFILGLEKYNISVSIEDKDNFQGALNTIKEKLKRHKASIKDFDIDNFNENEIVKKYEQDLAYIFEKYLNSTQINQLISYRTDYLKLNFLTLIES